MKVSLPFVQSLAEHAPAMGMRVIVDESTGHEQISGLVWTRFNPLTEADIVAEVDFEYEEDGIVELTYQLRDHDGNGPMLPCDCEIEYEDGPHFVLHELICAAMDYVCVQKRKYEDGIERNARRL